MSEINSKTLPETPTPALGPRNYPKVVDELAISNKATSLPDKFTKSCMCQPHDFSLSIFAKPDHLAVIEPVTVSNDTTTELEPYGARSAPQGASQEVNVQKPLSCFTRLKSAFKAVKAYMCPKRGDGDRTHRRGVYTFLYGGRVNLNTFYDYKCQEMH
ncbi:hypothetical protein DXG01_003002 [Tephrocybe rancida]|nr:hypothetical protein DXG01_003002 [Tephrocybe rancida]